ncbi:MAG TPA: flavodoxin domain-containing protein [bacterium]|nr:flavodoxin domain-containing protein [bacterium]HPN34479.1 flavodoxin domain-containing protein [bacterium]
MNILIAYASGFGSTKEIAEKIGQILQEPSALQVTLQTMEAVTDASPFDAIILGSSIRADQPLVSIMDFLAQNRATLRQKKIAVFLVCLTANCQVGREKVRQGYISQIFEKYPDLNIISSESFGGKIDFDKLNPVMQMLMKRVLEKTGIPAQGSVDTRDWNFISGWAHELKEKLLAV